MGGIERGEHNLALINILRIIKALDMQPSEFFKALDTSANELRNRTRVRNLAPAQAIDRGDTKGDTLGAHCQPPLENSNVVEFCCGALTR